MDGRHFRPLRAVKSVSGSFNSTSEALYRKALFEKIGTVYKNHLKKNIKNPKDGASTPVISVYVTSPPPSSALLSSGRWGDTDQAHSPSILTRVKKTVLLLS